MLIPEAWQNDPLMDDERRAFYQCAPASPASPAFVGLHACTLTQEHCCECCRRCMRGTSCVLVLQVAASHRKLFTFTAHQSSVADTTPAGAVSVSVSARYTGLTLQGGCLWWSRWVLFRVAMSDCEVSAVWGWIAGTADSVFVRSEYHIVRSEYHIVAAMCGIHDQIWCLHCMVSFTVNFNVWCCEQDPSSHNLALDISIFRMQLWSWTRIWRVNIWRVKMWLSARKRKWKCKLFTSHVQIGRWQLRRTGTTSRGVKPPGNPPQKCRTPLMCSTAVSLRMSNGMSCMHKRRLWAFEGSRCTATPKHNTCCCMCASQADHLWLPLRTRLLTSLVWECG